MITAGNIGKYRAENIMKPVQSKITDAYPVHNYVRRFTEQSHEVRLCVWLVEGPAYHTRHKARGTN